MNFLSKLFSKDEVNTGRQFEFDLAKAVCILGMVFVHAFEELSLVTEAETSAAYYVIVVILDVIFGAGTFMTCMGLGIAYSKSNTPSALMKRGVTILAIGYLLNFLRSTLPMLVLYGMDAIRSAEVGAKYLTSSTLCTDILMFAGVALLLFGLLKKCKLSDVVILGIAVVMSAVGSFIRFIDVGPCWLNLLLGVFVGTVDEFHPEYTIAPFPLLNWFLVVVLGYLLGKALRKCRDLEKYYAISLPVSFTVLAVYLAIAIPNELGMMSGELKYYYQLTTFDVLILIAGAIFATGVYHYVSKLFSDKVKNIIIHMSSNINSVYCIHWVILGWLSYLLEYWEVSASGNQDTAITWIALGVYVVSNILAELYQKAKKRVKK